MRRRSSYKKRMERTATRVWDLNLRSRRNMSDASCSSAAQTAQPSKHQQCFFDDPEGVHLPNDCSTDSPMATGRILEVHSICANNRWIPRWVVRQLDPKYPRGRWDSQAQWRRMTLKISRKWKTGNPIPRARSFEIEEQ